MHLPPYTVDMLLPEAHVGVEYDGPRHLLTKKKDIVRDAYILEVYGLPILRVTAESRIEDELDDFIEPFLDDVEERKIKMELALL